MVNMNEINKDRALELFDGDILQVYKLVQSRGSFTISISINSVNKYLVQELRKAGFTRVQVQHALGISLAKVTSFEIAKLPKDFLRALEVIPNPITLLQKSSEYAYEYVFPPKAIERELIAVLSAAGFSPKAIVRATSLNRRTIMRVRKKIKESDDR